MSTTTTTTTTQNTLGINLSILDLLFNSSSGKMPQLVLLPLGQGSDAATAAAVSVDLASLAAAADQHRGAGHHRSTTHKRAKRTAGRVCGQCGTSATVQWRKGPDGSTSLCNACGQRYHRRRAAEERQKNGRQRDQHKMRLDLPVLQHHQHQQHHNHHGYQLPDTSMSSTTSIMPSYQQRMRLPNRDHSIMIDTSSLTPRHVKYEPSSPVPRLSIHSPLSCGSPVSSPALSPRSPRSETIKRSTIYSLLN